jgi:hypothetical protein
MYLPPDWKICVQREPNGKKIAERPELDLIKQIEVGSQNWHRLTEMLPSTSWMEKPD